MCGEKCFPLSDQQRFEGSPPRVRGKGGFPFLPLRLTGITPACAGKSRKSRYTLLSTTDHPRVCGEKSAGAYQGAAALGSPPRVRGKVYSLTLWVPHGRITPACAGKSFNTVIGKSVHEDHPRVCGEKFSVVPQLPQNVGSPPRVRGKDV